MLHKPDVVANLLRDELEKDVTLGNLALAIGRSDGMVQVSGSIDLERIARRLAKELGNGVHDV